MSAYESTAWSGDQSLRSLDGFFHHMLGILGERVRHIAGYFFAEKAADHRIPAPVGHMERARYGRRVHRTIMLELAYLLEPEHAVKTVVLGIDGDAQIVELV